MVGRLTAATPWRVGWWWAAVVLTLLVGAIAIAVSGGSEAAADLTRYNGISDAFGPLGVLAIVFVLNGVGEEVGWRGFLADRLLNRHSLTVTALLVALAWAPWHAPLFLFLSSFEGFTMAQAVGWALGLTAGSFLLTWLYRGAHRSILLVAVWHTAFNFTSATSAGQGTAAAFTSTAVMIAAVVILVADQRARRRSPKGVLK